MVVDDATARAQFAAFKTRFHKQYASPADEARRFRFFKNSLTQINMLQASHTEAQFGINRMSDSSLQEWLDRSTSLVRPVGVPAGRQSLPESSHGPSASIQDIARSQERGSTVHGPPPSRKHTAIAPKDWRAEGKVNPVKNQGKCGNCWAFSAVATMESAWAIAGHPLESYSEEYLTDCNYPQSPGGCQGGFDEQAFAFVITNGIDLEASYPYAAGATGKPSNCTVNDVVDAAALK